MLRPRIRVARVSAAAAVVAFVFWLCGSECLAQQPQDLDPTATRQYAVALGFQKKKLFPQAAARWTTFLATFPKDPRIANARYHLGVCQFRQKKHTEAAATFRTVIGKFPKFKHLDGAQFNLGLVLYNVALASKKPADFKLASQTFTVLSAKFAKSSYAPDALYYRAECLYQGGDKEASLAIYSKVISGYPTSRLLPDVYYALGTVQQELEKHELAVQTFQNFLKKFPKDAQANECRLRIGMALSDQSKFAEAKKQFEQVAKLKEFPFADFALLRQAQALLDQDKLPEAATVYESLPKRFAKSSYLGAALLAGGKCRFRLKQFAPANKHFAAVVSQKLTEAPEAAYWLGRTLLELKKPADALKALDRAVAAYPKSDFLPQLAFTRIDALSAIQNRQQETIALYAGFAKKYATHPLAPDALYRASLTAFKLQQYQAAQQHAEAFLATAAFVKHSLVPELLFVGAESHLLAPESNLAKSEALYRRLIAEYPMHGDVSLAIVRIGFCLYSAKKYDPAIAHLTKSLPGLKVASQRAEAQLLIGRSHADAKRSKPAIAAFRAAMASDPKWDRGDEALFALAMSLRTENDGKNAVSELTRLIQKFPKSDYLDRASYQLGELAFNGKQFDSAIKNYRRVVTGFPKSDLAPLAQYGIAAVLFQKSDYKNSSSELNKLLAGYPKADVSASGIYLRGLCYQRLQNFAPAVKDLTKFLGGKPPEKDALDARFALAVCQAGLKQHPQAIASLRAIIKSKPDYAAADQVYYELGFAYLETKQEKEAAESFRLLATKLPDSPLAAESWFRVGEFYENAENLPEAAKSFAAGLAKAKQPPLRERLQYKLAWVRYEQSSFAEAVKTFQDQIHEHPKGELLGDATYMTGECLFRQNQFKEALPFFIKTVALNVKKYHARALYRSGTCTANIKQWPDSQKYYATLIKQFPKFEQIHESRYGLGMALQNQRKLDEAKQVYQQVTKETNTETAAKSRFMMGECAFAQKKYDEAVEHFLEAALGYPYKEWQTLGYFEAGRCFIQLKDTEKARETLQTVVDKFPKHPRAKDAMTLLANLNKNK